jgi:choline transport protein
MYAITDVQAVLDTPSGIPLIEIYYQSTKSKTASSVLLALFAFCFFGCTVANGGSLLSYRFYNEFSH